MWRSAWCVSSKQWPWWCTRQFQCWSNTFKLLSMEFFSSLWRLLAGEMNWSHWFQNHCIFKTDVQMVISYMLYNAAQQSPGTSQSTGNLPYLAQCRMHRWTYIHQNKWCLNPFIFCSLKVSVLHMLIYYQTRLLNNVFFLPREPLLHMRQTLKWKRDKRFHAILILQVLQNNWRCSFSCALCSPQKLR